MGDLVIRVESAAEASADEVADAVREVLGAAEIEADVEVFTSGDEGERVDPVSAVTTVTVLLAGLKLGAAEARKLLDEVAGLLRSAKGVKEAWVELAGRRVKLADAQPAELVAEAED